MDPSLARGEGRPVNLRQTAPNSRPPSAVEVNIPSPLHLVPLPLQREKYAQGDKNQERDAGRSSAPTVTVLVWWYPFGKKTEIKNCTALHVHGCHLTTDRRLYVRSQAVVIHHRDLERNPQQLPSGRRPIAQEWVWMNFESPSHSSRLEKLNGIFNWTMTYKRDSDIFVPYGYLYPRETGDRRIVLPKKTKLVAWVISNWNENHTRVKYYHQLKNYMNIDVYGKSGLDLKNDNVVLTVLPYKFYLAFENSQHVDYITEKLWRNSFLSSAVPVVMGPSRANYEQHIPAGSFIHVNDFSSPRKLAEYLMYLDEDEGSYKNYFEWKRHYKVHLTKFWEEQFCKVCKAVQSSRGQYKTISNLDSWFR